MNLFNLLYNRSDRCLSRSIERLKVILESVSSVNFNFAFEFFPFQMIDNLDCRQVILLSICLLRIMLQDPRFSLADIEAWRCIASWQRYNQCQNRLHRELQWK